MSGGRWREGLRTVLQATVGDNLIVFGILIPFALAAVAVDSVTGVEVADRLYGASLVGLFQWALPLTVLALGAPVAWFAVARLRSLRSAGRETADGLLPSLGEAWNAFEYRPTVRRFLRVLVCLMAIAVFFEVFSGFKGAIPVFDPFSWDETFMRLDRALHLGRHPWEILHPILGRPILTRFLDFMYYAWFPVNLALLLFFAWVQEGPHRRRFFLAYMSTWILLGNVAALAFSSAGPCYHDLATGSLGPYQGLMAYLQQVHVEHRLMSLEVQAILLEGYSRSHVNPVEGIAAMPSLHVAMPILMALAVRRYSRIAAVVLVGFGGVILLGSVHLGWHYAVDGYVVVPGVAVVWWSAGWIVNRWSGPNDDAPGRPRGA